eukprot:1838972-Lingulodinium_polyedra.AAC.1
MTERIAARDTQPDRRHRGAPLKEMIGSGIAGAAERADLAGAGRPIATRTSATARRCQGPSPRLHAWARFKD